MDPWSPAPTPREAGWPRVCAEPHATAPSDRSAHIARRHARRPVVKSALETLNPTRVKMTVEVSYDELKPSLDAAYKHIGEQIQVPGFRKGKVPARIIDQRVGRAAVLEEAVNNALPTFYGQAIEENKVRPLGQPEIDVTEVPAEDGEDLNFTAEVDMRPEIDLPDFSGIELAVDEGRRTRTEVEQRLDDLRARFGTLKGVERAGPGRRLRLDRPVRRRSRARRSTRSPASPTRSAPRTCSTVSTRPSSACRPARPRRSPPRSPAATARARRPTAPSPSSGQGARAARARRRVRPAGLRVRHPRRARGRPRAAGRDRSASSRRASRPATSCSSILEKVEVPIPEGIVEAEVHSHLEGEGRLEDDEHRAEVDESTRKAPARPSSSSTRSPRRRRSRSSSRSSSSTSSCRPQQYGMDPNQFAQSHRPAGPDPRDGRRGGPPQGARLRAGAGVGRRHRRHRHRPRRGGAPERAEAEGDAESEFDTEVVEVTAEDATGRRGRDRQGLSRPKRELWTALAAGENRPRLGFSARTPPSRSTVLPARSRRRCTHGAAPRPSSRQWSP